MKEELFMRTSHLQDEVQSYIRNVSETYQVHPDMVTLAVYTAAAVSAGKRVTTFDGTYTNRLSLWGILVGISGSGKTEFCGKVLEPLMKRNQKLIEEYEREKKKWNGKNKAEEPIPRDFRLHSVTLEALVEKINQTPDGLFLYRGELSGWVGSFGKYNRDDTEYASWIDLWDGKDLTVHTKTGNNKLIYAKDPCISVLGGVQPHIMKKFAKADFLGSGFLGRLLMVYPHLCYPENAPTCSLDEKLLDFWQKWIENNYLTSSQFLFSLDAIALYNDFCYKYVRERVLAIGENAVDPYSVCMLEFYGKIKVYAEKWAGLTMLLAGRSGCINEEIMQRTIEAMKVFEAYAQKTYGFIFSKDFGGGKGEIIRKLDKVFGVRNRSQLADGLGISKSLISDYLNQKK